MSSSNRPSSSMPGKTKTLLKVAAQKIPDYVFGADETKEFSERGSKVVWGEAELDVALEEVADKIRHRDTHPCEPMHICIPSFSEFFAIVSDAELDLLTLMLKKYSDYVKVITGDTPQKLAPFVNSEIYIYAIKQEQGIITNALELTAQVIYLRNDLTPPRVSPNFPFFLYYNQGNWNALDLEGS